mmetsp:Transcript_20165/g.43807  ORF Transcript_20165/g.43807 Transcript_20165/m.43807 type:complete len:242 (-) Transcript_20165:217-942(-)
MANNDVDWREYNIHAQDEEETHQPVDIFAPREEDVYEIHKYNFDVENENATITLREQSDYDVSTGMSVWKGSEILCQYLTKHPDLIREKRILELGAGVGLCGIVSAKVIGASYVLLTDGDHMVLRNLRYNVELNELGTKVSCPQLIWGKTKAKVFEKEHGKQDVILATDCVYVTKSVRPLFETIAELLAPNGVFLFVNSCASICSLKDVMNIGKEFGFSASSDELWCQPGNEKDPVYVFRR